MERNTGFEPATFALAMSREGVHESSGPYTNLHDPVISFGSLDPDEDPGSTNLHADSLASCAQHVPRRRSRDRAGSHDHGTPVSHEHSPPGSQPRDGDDLP